MTDPNDWEPREIGVEFSPSLKRWRYNHTKKLIPTDVPVIALSTVSIVNCEYLRNLYLKAGHAPEKIPHYANCVEYLDHHIACLKTQALLTR